MGLPLAAVQNLPMMPQESAPCQFPNNVKATALGNPALKTGSDCSFTTS
jgi:hypothetical protein